MTAAAALSLAMPQLIRWIIDRGIRRQDLRLLLLSVGGLLLLAGIRGLCTFLQGRWSEQASQGVACDLRSRLYGKLASLSFSWHDRAETGQLLSRAIQDVEKVRFLTGRAVLRVVDGALLMTGTLALLLTMSPALALLLLPLLPLLLIRALRFGRRYRPLSQAIQEQLGVLTSRLEQNLRGARVVKAFCREEVEIGRFEAENARWFALASRSAGLQALNVPVLSFITNVGTVAVILFGGREVMRGALTIGELVAFTVYLGQLVMPVRRLGLVIPAIVQGAASGERVFEILDAVSEVREKPEAVEPAAVRGGVRFENVSFAYFGRHRVLEEVSFEVQPGQTVALLGPSGSGKSTIINLLPRFYDPTGGRILLDGCDIRDLTLGSLRRAVGVVLQESTLFASTVRENIAFGRGGASREEIEEAARAAQAHEFIQDLPEGYDTRVGERGVTLSGGQRQRIAIARTLLADPRVLILDDSTSSVDTRTERLIRQALRLLMRGRTSFVVAQRLDTVREADLILVLDKGRVAARGTHAQLLASSGLYADICHRQLRPREEGCPAEDGGGR